ncbi:MAG: PhzF family phenazine biosynthesis protein [Xanthomonadaceae bacterium]|nr:PhzF family phenazine biosynthesis protein [Silanimonas sp.]MBS3924502.1 PhzF family phenazine biosynthesis protein [Xanthomonadaceae bacterium]
MVKPPTAANPGAVAGPRRARRFQQVDVFTARAGGGNPLAVVLDSEGLDTATMQRIAAWTDVVETTFVLPPDSPEASYRLRIFTPSRELAFAGHPSVGTAHAVLQAGWALPRPLAGGGTGLIQECGAGLLPLRITGEGVAREIAVQAPPVALLSRHGGEDAALSALLGASLAEAGGAVIDGGRRWFVAELRDEAAVRGLHPDFAGIAALVAAHDAIGLTVFARTPSRDHDLVVRALMPVAGGYEDPASGAANAALAGYLHGSGQAAGLGDRYVVSQGREVGRDARLVLHHEAGRIWVGGPCCSVVTGTLQW